MVERFAFGQQVEKIGGDYQFVGTVRGVIIKRSNALRYVVEDDRGILHIFSEKNLRTIVSDCHLEMLNRAECDARAMTDEEIMLAHYVLVDAENVEDAARWLAHWKRVNILDTINNAHFGDCTKAPITCLRCLAEEAKRMVPVYRKLFYIPESPK